MVCLAEESNYPFWNYSAEAILEEYRLTDYCREIDPEPRPETNSPNYAAFRSRESKAVRILFHSLHDNFKSLVLGKKKIPEFMTAIRQRFTGEGSEATVPDITAQLIQKCPENGNVVETITRLNTKFALLSEMEKTFDEDVKIGILYGVMPDKFKSCRSLLDETKNESYSHACNTFVRAYGDTKSSADHALITCYDCGKIGHKSSECNKRNDNKNNLFCRYCKTSGHTKRECRKLKAKQSGGNRSNRHNFRNNRRSNHQNPRFQANCVGTAEAYVLITEYNNPALDLEIDTDDDMPDLISVHSDSASDSDSESDHENDHWLMDFEQPYSSDSDFSDNDDFMAEDNDGCIFAYDFESDSDSFEPVVFTMGKKSNNGPYIDSGCSVHMWNGGKEQFSDYVPLHNKFVRVGDDRKLPVLGKGTVALTNVKSDINSTVSLTETLHVPGLKKSLISVSALDDHGCTINFRKGKCEVYPSNDGLVLFSGTKVSDGSQLYQLDLEIETEANLVDYKHQNDLELMHYRFGHCHDAAIRKLPELTDGLNRISSNQRPFCVDCPLGKMQRLPKVKDGDHRATELLQIIHCDMKGPINPPTPSGMRYLLLYLDDFSGIMFPYLVKNRTNQQENFHKFRMHVEKLFGCQIEMLVFFRTDGAREFIESEFLTYLADIGIGHQLRAADQPQQLGRPERAFRTIFNMVRTMLVQSELSKTLWGQAALSSVFILNRLPTSSNPGLCTPFEMAYGYPPDLSGIRVWGSKCYAFEDDNPALANRAIECRLIGFVGEDIHAYRLLNSSTGRALTRYNVIFDESSVIKSSTASLESFDFGDISDDLDSSEEVSLPPSTTAPAPAPAPTPAPSPAPAVRRSSRPSVPRQLYDPSGNAVEVEIEDIMAILGDCYATTDAVEPRTYAQAINSEDSAKWIAAMGEEISALVSNDTWQLTPLPDGANLLKGGWVFKIKRNESGEITRYKARFVAKGYTQEHGVDFFETFAPVAKIQTIRLLFFIAVQHDVEICQFDIPNAYVKAPVEEDIFIEQPKGFIDENNPELVLKLKKALYGTKQAGRNWNKELTDFVISLGFQQSSSDPCLFYMALGNGFMLIAVYVDDIISMSTLPAEMERILKAISEKFSITNLGFPKWFLGIKITKTDNGNIILDQSRAVMDLLGKFNLSNCSVVSFPISAKTHLAKLTVDEACTTEPYRSLVGSLMYLMTSTRLDLAVAVSTLGQFMANPGPTHWSAAKRVGRYLKGTADFGLESRFTPDLDFSNLISAYCDADWATDPIDRKSFSGYVIFVGSCVISWKCKKQTAIAMSTAEAEYMALALVAMEVIWMRKLLADIGFEQTIPSTIYCDNKSAIHIATNEVISSKTKHIDIKYHFIRNHIQNGDIKLEYIPSAQNLADFFTKPLENTKFKEFRRQLNLTRTTGI